MTEKELKKLSRLELLELLLAQSRENEKLREELDFLKKHQAQLEESDKTKEDISLAAEQLSKAMCYADSVIKQLRGIKSEDGDVFSREPSGQNDVVTGVVHSQLTESERIKAGSDRALFRRIMDCYCSAPTAMSELPIDIQKDIINRLKEFKNAK